MSHTLTIVQTWADTGTPHSTSSYVQPGTAEDARNRRIRRLKDAGTRHAMSEGVVSYGGGLLNTSLSWVDDDGGVEQLDLFTQEQS